MINHLDSPYYDGQYLKQNTANAGKVDRAIEETAARCVEDGEYIAEPEEIEKVEEPVSIRRRRARQRCLAFSMRKKLNIQNYIFKTKYEIKSQIYVAK